MFMQKSGLLTVEVGSSLFFDTKRKKVNVSEAEEQLFLHCSYV